MRVSTPACAVGRLGDEGPWVGFAPVLDNAYALVVGGTAAGPRRSPADPDDLLSLAIAYFEDALAAPPEELAATHGDIGSLVRSIAELEHDQGRRRLLREAVDAVDDGLATDVVVGRLNSCLAAGEEPIARLTRRAAGLIGD